MIDPTDEMAEAGWSALPVSAQESGDVDLDDMKAVLTAVLAIVARDRCLERRGHVFHPLAKRNQPLPLSVGRIQSYCGRVERPHAGHVWVTEPGRWCPGDEVRT